MRVEFSPAFESDLTEIGDYISEDNPVRAVSFVDELIDHALSLSENPERGVVRDDLLPGIRMLVHGRYLIFYTLGDKTVRVERIVHGSRNLADLIG